MLAALIAVISLLIWGVSAVFGGGDKASSSPQATGTSQGKPAPDEPCKPADLKLALNTAPSSVTTGNDAAFDVAVTNGGEHACTIDLGDKARVLTITSGKDRIWSSADCPSEGSASRLVLLRPGSMNTSTVVWDGARSDSKCAEDLPKPRPGTYKLEVQLEGVKPVEHRFEIAKG